MRYAIINLGCKVNKVEADEIAASLNRAGGCAVSCKNAEAVIVNTCTVTGEADKKTRKAVRRAVRENATARIIVTGCAAAIDAEALASIDARVEVMGKNEVVPSLIGVAGDGAALRVGEAFPTRVGVKVQDGCDNACTYCIVHTARGRSWSKPFDDAVSELAGYAASGVNEIVLTGINIGSYASGGMRIADLLEAALEATRSCRFRISSIEPCNVDQRLISLIGQAEGRICRHLHLPLQSGSDKVLEEMARPYSAAMFTDLVQSLYGSIPEMALSTDAIVGFPGETAEDFAQTMEVARRCRFSKMHIFPYSIREGTPAAIRIDQVDAEEKKKRAAELGRLAEALRMDDCTRRAGTMEAVLVEKRGIGTTESYYRVPVDEAHVIGSLARIALPQPYPRAFSDDKVES